MADIVQKTKELVQWLKANRTKAGPFEFEETRKYFRIVGQNAAHCFVAKTDSNTKTLGKIKKGDLLKPASFAQPAKHARGNLFDKSSWDKAFTEVGMALLR